MAITEASKGTSQRNDWATPWPLFRLLEREFRFTLDPCATAENTKVRGRFYTEADDGLKQSWSGERVWLNPPYGKEAPRWVEKAYEETRRGCPLVVCLIVPRSDTEWFHRFVPHAHEVRFLKGRVAFEDPTTGKRNSPQDPSCLVVFRAGEHGSPWLTFWDWKTALRDC